MGAQTSWWSRLRDKPGLLGRVRRQWPWVVVIAATAVGLLLVWAGAWRVGGVAIGAGMVCAGLLRTVMRQPGIVAIRKHRWIDLCFYYGLGLATIVVSVLVRSR